MTPWAPLDAHLARSGLLVTLIGLSLGALCWTRFGRRWDRATFLAINRLPSQPLLDWLIWSLTHLGSTWAGIGLLTCAALLPHPRFGVVTALALLTMGIITGVTKALTQRQRPFVQLQGVRVVGLRPADLSYPSGHAAMAFNAATLLTLGLGLGWPERALAYLLAAGVGYSRVHLGVHYPLDVVSGAAFGTGWGMLWASYLYR